MGGRRNAQPSLEPPNARPSSPFSPLSDPMNSLAHLLSLSGFTLYYFCMSRRWFVCVCQRVRYWCASEDGTLTPHTESCTFTLCIRIYFSFSELPGEMGENYSSLCPRTCETIEGVKKGRAVRLTISMAKRWSGDAADWRSGRTGERSPMKYERA